MSGSKDSLTYGTCVICIGPSVIKAPQPPRRSVGRFRPVQHANGDQRAYQPEQHERPGHN